MERIGEAVKATANLPGRSKDSDLNQLLLLESHSHDQEKPKEEEEQKKEKKEKASTDKLSFFSLSAQDSEREKSGFAGDLQNFAGELRRLGFPHLKGENKEENLTKRIN